MTRTITPSATPPQGENPQCQRDGDRNLTRDREYTRRSLPSWRRLAPLSECGQGRGRGAILLSRLPGATVPSSPREKPRCRSIPTSGNSRNPDARLVPRRFFRVGRPRQPNCFRFSPRVAESRRAGAQSASAASKVSDLCLLLPTAPDARPVVAAAAARLRAPKRRSRCWSVHEERVLGQASRSIAYELAARS